MLGKCSTSELHPPGHYHQYYSKKKAWRKHLTEEYKLSKVFLEKSEHGKVDFPVATKESLATECPFSFQGPHIYFFLAVSKRAVARISALLFCSHIWKGREEKRVNDATVFQSKHY
jgi:hypothetical protein